MIEFYDSVYDPRDRGPSGVFGMDKFQTPFKGSKSNSTQTTHTEDNDTDASAAVQDKGIAATNGATAARDEAVVATGDNVTIETVDEDIAIEALWMGRDVGETAIESNETVAREALLTSEEQLDTALQFGEFIGAEGFDFGREAMDHVAGSNDNILHSLEEAFDFARASQEAANRLSVQQNEVSAGMAQRYGDTLAAKSEDSASAVGATLQRNILIALSIVAAITILKR
ncbi:MAG: hypothetical protein ACOC4K_00795 [Verrucomicrobiota bacterium]